MKNHFLLLLVACVSISGYAQAPDLLPQVFSPDAAELGKYGKVPVNYFNGLPDITIPLTEVRAKNYTLPIFLSYHASGNKPEQHPGWVGQGWSLHAGGCINRIINGLGDEMIFGTKPDTSLERGPGYLYHSDEFQRINWNDCPVDATCFSRLVLDVDYEPDEFQVNIDDIKASFYFAGNGKVKIVSKTSTDFTVSYTVKYYNSLNLKLYDLDIQDYGRFYEFVLTKKDGTKYYFGGNENAIEYSITPCVLSNKNMEMVATANTWMLTKIVRPDGEEITFKYARDGAPIVMTDSHYLDYSITNGVREDKRNTFEPKDKYDSNIHFTILYPSYLNEISCRYGTDRVVFNTTVSTQLDYDYSPDLLYEQINSSIPTELRRKTNHYMQLSDIETHRGKILCSYSSGLGTRLKLNTVAIVAEQCDTLRYKMTYNRTALPRYNTRKIDLWGYYNSTVPYEIEPLETLEQRRSTVNPELLQAEMLIQINYPTGGRTCFEYEPHDYGKVATQFPFGIDPQMGVVGGLRIRKITNYPMEGKPEERTFSYKHSDGRSSGILAGKPLLYIEGFSKFRFVVFSEETLNQLSYTDGNHVTYSMVTESVTGHGRTEYSYSNHDTETMQCMDQGPISKLYRLIFDPAHNPFSSMSLSRGLLLRKAVYDETGKLVMNVNKSYAQDLNDFLYSIFQYSHISSREISRVSLLKLYTYYPALTRETVSTYSDGGILTKITEYEYNEHRQLVKKVSSNMDCREETRYTYSGDMPCDHVVYGKMQEAGMIDLPIEQTTLRNRSVISSMLTTYRVSTGKYVPDKYYMSRMSEPIASQNWQRYEGAISPWQLSVYGEPRVSFDLYDKFGNILSITEEDGQNHRYIWDSSGRYPEASFDGKMPPLRNLEDAESAFHQVDFQEKDITSYTFEFDADRSGTFGFLMEWPYTGTGSYKRQYPYRLYGTMDGTVFIRNEPTDFFFTDNDIINIRIFRTKVSAGHHTFVLYLPEGFTGTDYLRGKGTISYPIDNLGAWYYNFESDGNCQKGFNSKKSWQGEKTFTQTIPSDISYTIDWMELGSDGKWTCKSAAFSGSKTIGDGAEAIDNVRIYPSGAVATSWTWTDKGELSSVTDGSGITKSYLYDCRGRLATVLDTDSNKVASYAYHYMSPSETSPDNYVKTSVYTSEAGTFAQEILRYHDGLGRPWQTLMVNAGNGSHLYEQTDYDSAGRPFRTWLPCRTGTIGVQSGEPSEMLYSDAEPFSLVEYDDSPLDRPRAEYGPGANWHANGKAVRHEHHTNSNSGLYKCSLYSVRRTGDTTVVVSRSGNYHIGMLSVKSVTDEDGLTLLTFTDMYGRTLLERRHPVSGEDLDTYYVYDGLGRLSAVIPPALSKLDLSTENVDKYAYLYSYDANGNCIAKKLPGCGWIYYIYDKGNRLVFAQDAEQRKRGKWMFSFSDILGRSCLIGICEGGREALRQMAAASNIVASRQGNASGTYMGYHVDALSLTNPIVMSVSYYDDYGFINSQVPSGLRAKMRYRKEYNLTNWEHVHGLLTGRAERILGEDITNDFMWSTCYYDRKGNLIQTHGTRADGGVDIATTEYTFTGNPKRTLIRHSFGAQNSMLEYYTYTYDGWGRPLTVKHRIGSDGAWTTVSNLKYDGIGRVKSDNRNGKAALRMNYTYNVRSWTKNITGPGLTEDLFYEDRGQWGGNIGAIRWSAGTGTEEFNDTYQYDGLSRLLSSHRYGSSKPNHKYINDYVYDLQGNMLQSSYRDENLINQRRVGGIVISELEGNATTKTFNYDGNRLISSSTLFSKYDRGYDLPTSVDSLAASFSYDRDGRIVLSDMDGMTEVRYNAVGYPSYVKLADGGYVQNKYTAGGARLESRRMEADGKLTSMAYEGNEVIENGKLRMLMFDGGYVDFSGDEPRYCWYTKDHLGSVRAVADAEGNVFASYAYGPYGEDFVAERTVTSNAPEGDLGAQPADAPVYGGEIPHVGQMRPGVSLPATTPAVTYTANEGPDWQPCKFSGKENLTKVGLDLYDFGARMYSPSNMRWMTMDPLAEKYYSISPYVYCLCSPLLYVDPDGLVPRIYVNTKEAIGHTFVTVGEGKETVVYTYGRYGALGFLGHILHKYTPTGEGVLKRLSGKRALEYIKEQLDEGATSIYEIYGADDKEVSSYFDHLWNEGWNSKVLVDQDARVIDSYNLFNNNCTTKSIDAINNSVNGIVIPTTTTYPLYSPSSPALYEGSYPVYSPKQLESILEFLSAKYPGDVRKIDDPIAFFKGLNNLN